MSHDRIHMLTGALAVGSRRGLLTWLSTGISAMLLLARDRDDVRARSCPPCRKKKNGKCRKKKPDGAACGYDGQCRNGRCDPNFCRLDCPPGPPYDPQPCGPASSPCECVRIGDVGEDVGACVKSQQGESCELGQSDTCEAGQVCGISCAGYLPLCWELCD